MGTTPQEVGTFLISLITPISIGAAAAFITAWLTLRRTYKEKWWEKKHSAYNELVDRLLELQDFYRKASRFYEAEHDALRLGKEEPEDRNDWDRFSELRIAVKRFSILSPIKLSVETQLRLKKFIELTNLKNDQVYYDGWPRQIAYRELAEELDSVIEDIVSDASKELHFH